MEFNNLLLHQDGAIANVILNRPDQLNALSPEAYNELRVVFDSLDKDDSARVVVLSARGRAFCAGADLKEIKSKVLTPEAGTLLDASYGTYDTIERCGKPVIAAVHGMVLAGGLELVLCCDIVIASDDAQIGDQHARFGLIPGGGGSQRLPRKIGVGRAKDLLLTGKWLSAVEAERIGLINRVVPREQLEATAAELARELAERSPAASRAIKRLVHYGMQTDLAVALEFERTSVLNHFRTADFQEGLKAFEEKRKPVFTGR